jgi:hypothetical protein
VTCKIGERRRLARCESRGGQSVQACTLVTYQQEERKFHICDLGLHIRLALNLAMTQRGQRRLTERADEMAGGRSASLVTIRV